MTTPAEIIYHRRVRLLDLAQELDNVSEACRQLGISRTRYCEWKHIADQYGVEALWPKDRRRPAQPNETPTHVVADLFALVIIEPTIGCRQYADRFAELGFTVSKSTVQRILVDHQLGRRRKRVARAAAVALRSGLVTEPATEDIASPFGFCRWAGAPGDLVALDSFYIGKPQRCRQGVPTHRVGHLHPLGDRALDHRAGHRRGHDPVHRTTSPAPCAASASPYDGC